jgi:hypothetical protein
MAHVANGRDAWNSSVRVTRMTAIERAHQSD